VTATPGPLAGLPRRWWFPGLGDLRAAPGRPATYTPWDLDRLPPIVLDAEPAIDLLARWPETDQSMTDDRAVRPMDGPGLDALLAHARIGPVAPSLERFIRDPGPRRRLRSVTASFLDLAESAVPVEAGGALIHVVTDQQWVLHWLAYVPPGGGDGPVVVTSVPYGLGADFDAPARFDPREADPELPDLPSICADTFDEFLVRFLLENEAWHRIHPDIDGDAPDRPELEAYLQALGGRPG
jgi:hypothetical protein